jgi:hypothetical protein
MYKSKKLAIAALVALGVTAGTTAHALDLGVGAAYDPRQDWGYSVTAGQKTGALSLAASYERYNAGANNQNRYGVTAGYDLAKLGPVTFAGKLGAAYLDNSAVSNGWAGTLGVGAVLPVTKALAVTADYRYQLGETRVDAFNGNAFVVGLSYRF